MEPLIEFKKDTVTGAENTEGETALRPEDIIGANIYDLIHRDYHFSFDEAFKNYEPFHCFFRKPGGMWSFVEITPIKRKKSFKIQECRESYIFGNDYGGRNFRHFVERFKEVYFREDLFGNTIYISDYIENITGFSPEELTGRKLSESIINPSALNRDVRAILGLAGETVDFKIPMTSKSGEEWWGVLTVQRFHNEYGQVTGTEGMIRDYTKEKQDNDEHIKSLQDKYKLLFDGARDAILIYEYSHRTIRDANKSAQELTGYSLAELTKIRKDSLHPGTELQINAQNILEYSDGPGGEIIEMNLRRKGGEQVPVEVTGFTINVGDKRYGIDFIRDISERLNADNRQREQEQMLIEQSKLASMGEMINNIAHQWRQPLAKLSGLMTNVELSIMGGTLTDEELTDALEDSGKTLAYMSETIDTFRKFNTPSQGKEHIRLSTILEESITIVKASYISEEIRWEVLKKHDSIIFVNRNELSQVVMNILHNARDALKNNPPENREMTFEISVREECASLLITDNAGGITVSPVKKVFEPYFTTKPDGQGNGLYISKMIIEKHLKGRLEAFNTKNGAAFEILIPLPD